MHVWPRSVPDGLTSCITAREKLATGPRGGQFAGSLRKPSTTIVAARSLPRRYPPNRPEPIEATLSAVRGQPDKHTTLLLMFTLIQRPVLGSSDQDSSPKQPGHVRRG
ncbi:hypothetical protein Ae201684P_004919 [Aphanomyces euteiches]|uniref:Uncharacterized protein n=1 Tax=Aphanomyces euteiches TaxID=100861 RepID=A0A6G0XCL6_9STRA|nr:hypothetical protein Ae201684_005902 [Aphanomyces euteiches]KAH9069230.1 hypothetical protein Ae201684P_004919 [Aphanomyces euteiches]